MDAARLKPHTRTDSQREDHASDYQSSDDGYDYNIVDDAPEAQPTKAKEFKPAKVSQAPNQSSASRGLEDADIAFTETMPHIWQRQAGSRSAKIPYIDPDLEKGISDSATTDKRKSLRAPPEVKNFKLRWSLPEIKGRRVLQLDAGRPDVEIQEHYLQRRRVRWQ